MFTHQKEKARNNHIWTVRNLAVQKNFFMNKNLDWTDEQRKEIEKRILNLRKDQIGALLYLSGLTFSKKDLHEVIEDIVKNREGSGHLPILIEEGDLKELLWWLEFFESTPKNH